MNTYFCSWTLVFIVAFAVILTSKCAVAQNTAPQHALVGKEFKPRDVDYANPVYETSFDDESALEDWQLEGGKSMSVSDGNLVLESEPVETDGERDPNHLVCWLKKEIPANFLLEFNLKPKDRKRGLNIIFFNARGLNGESIFDPSLQKRNGIFKQYHSGDLNSYHVSYWAGDRGFSNLRKNRGFHLVASGKDYIIEGEPGSFQTVQIYKQGERIRLIVNGIVALAFDDDGKTYGTVHTHSGWIGLRQMGHTLRCEYEYVKVYALK